jgi:hypothetical protein
MLALKKLKFDLKTQLETKPRRGLEPGQGYNDGKIPPISSNES